MDSTIKASRFGRETTHTEKEKQERRNKRVKMCVISVLGFLLLNFVLVLIAMNRTSESESEFSSSLSKLEGHQVQIEALESGNRELKKSHEELNDQFESLSLRFDQLENNISSALHVSLQNCGDAMKIFPSPRSAKQTIYPHGNRTSLEVLCDFETDGGGWTIIQKRTSGPKEQFQQNWTKYQNGFGSLDGNFWIGLEKIRALTKNGDQELRIQLEDFEGEKRWAKYSSFSVADASDFYRLTIGAFSGDSTLQDSMTGWHNGQRFSTIDKDNDDSDDVNCAPNDVGGGGWWFGFCSRSNLNGLYFEKGETVPTWQGILWDSWKGAVYSMAKTEMKIRKRKS